MSDTPPSPDSRPFPRLGSYQIIRQLGSGGMSNVFEAIHTETNNAVALKVLPRKLAQNAVLLQRFLKEAKSAENLDHPNIVAIYDHGFDQGRHYLVLEYVTGKDLFDRIRSNGPMSTNEAIAFIQEVALGLEYAAKLGMIHRDIKPANLLMTPEGHAKIIDLGLALMAEDEDERVTRDGTTVGTVDYMSPEQARDSRKINERSDIYSLGCTLHYLVTGYPPFPGGNLADKLARHHSATIPDVRDRNPTISASLAHLIQRMMAKKPEQRFANYGELIAALGQLAADPVPQTGGAIPDVLIDDEDEDEDEPLVLTVATPPESPRPSHRGKSASPDRGKPAPPERVVPEISLADLAALDSDEKPGGRGGRIHRATKPLADPSSSVADALLEETTDGEDGVAIGRRGGELPLQTWIVAGVMVGLLIAVVGFGVRFFLSLFQEPGAAQPVASGAPVQAGTVESSESNESGTYAATPPRLNDLSSRRKPFELVGPVPPADRSSARNPQRPAEIRFSNDLLTRLGLSLQPAIRTTSAVGTVLVRRLAESTDAGQMASIAAALGRANDDLEIVDVGPFHEDDFHISGKQRIIRGKGGLRPILKVEATWQTLVRDQEAKFLLGLNGIEQLLIEGIDLVVDVRDLPASQSTLFLCQGADLTLRDCSITIVNAEDRRNGFTIFRIVSGPRPNRLLLERSLIRGPIQILAQMSSGSATLTLDRSIVVGASGPLIQLDSADRTTRTIQCARSLLVSRGPVIAWVGKPSPTVLRVLGSTFAHVDPSSPGALWTAKAASATEAKAWLDYDGEANRYVGWGSLAPWEAGSGSSPAVINSLRSLRAEADRQSQESSRSWPMSAIAETATSATCFAQAPDLDPALQSVAAPHPFSLEMTADSFDRLPSPGLLDDFSSEPRSSSPRPTINLTFDASSGRQIDFGLFLKEQVIDPTKRYVVRLPALTNQPMTPVRLPDGSSLTIIGPGGSGPINPVPVFFTAAPGLALIELHQGDLAMANVGFASDGTTRTQHWIWVEDSLLALRRCRYRDVGQVEDSSGLSAISFGASTSAAIGNRTGGFKAAPARPIASLDDCWIWTNGDGIDARMGRGTVELNNCLLLSGSAAFRLTPQADRAGELEADLLLEHCTIWDDRFGIVLQPAGEDSTDKGRPFLITSRSSVFPRSGREGGALLGVDPATFARGRLFWQSSNDLYEVSRFLVALGVTSSAAVAPADLKRHWVDLWGLNHTRNDRGPDPRRPERVLHYRDRDRPRTGKVTPQQLELDPKLHSDQGVDFKLLPPIPKT